MTANQLLPDVNAEFVGISDVPALSFEVNALRGELLVLTSQMELERQLADDIHRARTIAIIGSPALRLVFDVDEKDELVERRKISTPASLSAAFGRQAPITPLPEGYSKTMSQILRTAVHPDAGGDTEVAKQVGGSLAETDMDEAYAIAKALAVSNSARDPQVKDLDALREERYRLTLALRSTVPTFETEEAAREAAEIEIEGAPWRVRSVAAIKCFQLILGDNAALNRFIQSVASSGNQNLANYMNIYLPATLSLQERLAKGIPRKADGLDIDGTDAIFERIWSTLGNQGKDSTLPYSPPYQNWLEIIMPAMRMLDPGEKPGEDYTHFQRPFQIAVQQPRNTYHERTFHTSEPEEDSYINKYMDTEYISKDKKY